MGYVMVDNRAAGGILDEYDWVSCRHCQAVVQVRRRQHTGLWCMVCGGPVCDTKECGSHELSFKQKLDKAFQRAHLFRQMGLDDLINATRSESVAARREWFQRIRANS